MIDLQEVEFIEKIAHDQLQTTSSETEIDESDDLQMVYFQKESKASNWRPQIKELPPRSIESVPSSVQPPKPDLKSLPFNLKYLFLGENETFLVIISSKHNARQEGKLLQTLNVRSHIGSERPEPGPYKCILTLTSKTCFGVMRGCQEQNREGDLGGNPGFGWTGRPKTDNILLVRWGVTFGIRVEDGSS